MGAFVVGRGDEGIEACLLLQDVRRGGFRRLAFEGEMHALMPAQHRTDERQPFAIVCPNGYASLLTGEFR